MLIIGKILALAVVFYLLLAIGIHLIARLVPVPRKPLMNVVLLGGVIVGFLITVAGLLVR